MRLCTFCLLRTKLIAAFIRNNDLFSTVATSRLGLKMSLFLTQAAMNFVLERQNGRKRSICEKVLKLRVVNFFYNPLNHTGIKIQTLFFERSEVYDSIFFIRQH